MTESNVTSVEGADRYRTVFKDIVAIVDPVRRSAAHSVSAVKTVPGSTSARFSQRTRLPY